MKISVTQEDIVNGEPESCSNCPIARAIRRELEIPAHCHVYVDSPRNVMFGFQDYTLDTAGSQFIEAFDNGRIVHPIVVELEELNDE